MSVTVLQGQRGTTVLGTETRRTRDVTPALSQLEPDAGPLVTLLTKLRKRAATDPKIEWFEDQLLPRFDVLGGSLSSSATSMTVTNYKYFRKGDLVRVNKSEIVRVTTTPSSTTVAIKRAVGEVSGTAAANGDQLHILSNSNQEGATKRSLLSTQRVPQYNYCQIIRHPFGYTETALATETFGGKDMDQERSKNLIEHKKDIEYAYILGQRYEDTSGDHPERTTRGIAQWITTNVTDVGGPLTEELFDNFLRPLGRFGEKTKFGLLSPIMAQAINGFAKDKLRTVSADKSYGITLTMYENAGRKVLLHEHNLLTNDSLGDFSGIGGSGYFLDIGDLEARYMKGRFTQLRENIQDNSADAREDEYLSETGLEAKQERKHGELTGVTA